MNFYQLVFLEKNIFENICKKVGFWGNYPLLLYGHILYLKPIGAEAITWHKIKNHIDFIQYADLH